MKRKNKETLSADMVSYKPDLKDKKVWYGILLGVAVVGIAMERIWRLNKKNNITDLKQVTNNQYINLYKAKEELIILSKNNTSGFFLKFKEMYPEFCEKLLQIKPDLINSELKFCAYLKLNFSTNEIAKCNKVTAGAIQIRKNRLRKKLNIPAGKDIYLWIDSL
ncbi:helix-turn-helix transcriptional regulator [Chryseobacterium sp. IT-36CA2]|uniref:helix-turn-helix transcriptional regulator n=1 Tax=Chryseobacterium sp. IT-36CA2 TaxID=3026460 RepID=UPI0039E0258A